MTDTLPRVRSYIGGTEEYSRMRHKRVFNRHSETKLIRFAPGTTG